MKQYIWAKPQYESCLAGALPKNATKDEENEHEEKSRKEFAKNLCSFWLSLILITNAFL